MALTSYLVAGIKPWLRQNEDFWNIGRQVRILDATDIQDRGYNDRKAIEKLRSLKIGETGEWDVQFIGKEGRKIRARVCAVRKSPEQAARARAKIRYKSRGQAGIRPVTLEYAEFVVLVTTLTAEELPLRAVLEFYRARWQVELAFKRLKSLLQMGQLPKKKEASCKSWMQGKILTALLIERLMCERFFPRGDTPYEEHSHWILFKEFAALVLVQLAMPLSLADLQKNGKILGECISECRRNRPRQIKRMRASLSQVYAYGRDACVTLGALTLVLHHVRMPEPYWPGGWTATKRSMASTSRLESIGFTKCSL